MHGCLAASVSFATGRDGRRTGGASRSRAGIVGHDSFLNLTVRVGQWRLGEGRGGGFSWVFYDVRWIAKWKEYQKRGKKRIKAQRDIRPLYTHHKAHEIISPARIGTKSDTWGGWGNRHRRVSIADQRASALIPVDQVTQWEWSVSSG